MRAAGIVQIAFERSNSSRRAPRTSPERQAVRISSLNARSETVAEKPSFRAAYRHRRCLVLADGFYEWKREGDVKIPYFISLASGEPFAFAGLWESWTGKETVEVIQSATLITAAANEYLSQVHHRMPVVLQPETAERWLAGDNDLIGDVAANSPEFQAWPVDRKVNNARNEGADLIIRLDSRD